MNDLTLFYAGSFFLGDALTLINLFKILLFVIRIILVVNFFASSTIYCFLYGMNNFLNYLL